MTTLAAVGEGLAEISLGDTVMLGYGGDASNIGVMAARLGADVRLAGRVGDDGLGRRLLAFWRENTIDVAAVRIDAAAATGLYVNEALASGHTFTYWRAGSAGSRLAPDDIVPSLFDGLDALVVTGVTLAVSHSSERAAAHAVGAARAAGVSIVCVLNHRPALGGDVAKLAAFAQASDVLIASREDAQAVFGEGDPIALRRILVDGPDEFVLTDGSRPAVHFGRDEAWLQRVPAATVRNAGGAGDALAGAFLAARLRGEDPPRCLAWGVAAATLSVGREGCARAYPTAAETSLLMRGLAPAEPLALDTVS